MVGFLVWFMLVAFVLLARIACAFPFARIACALYCVLADAIRRYAFCATAICRRLRFVFFDA
jgi:hypothetical protein